MTLERQKRYNRALRQWILQANRLAKRLARSELRRRPCPVCGSRQSRWFADNDALTYDRCQRCSLLFMNPAPRPAQLNAGFKGADALAMDYFRIIQRFAPPPEPRPDPRRDGKLRDIYRFKKSGRLLDVGCSIGTFLQKAAPFYKVEGVEVNPLTAAIAAKHFLIHQGYLSELHLPRVYDIVTLHQILYGVPDPVELLRDIRKVLKPTGILYINTPNADSYAMQLFRGRANHLYGYTTQNVFNRRSLAMAAGAAGFRVVAFRTEWLDIYTPDLLEFVTSPETFVHKRNTHRPRYEEQIQKEDAQAAKRPIDLGDRGNYVVAVLRPR